MMKYYRAMLGEVGRHYNLNPSDLHDMFKKGYKKQSTAKLSHDEYYEYLDNIHYFIMCCFDMSFDSDYYKYENISFVWLYGSMRPSNFYLLF